MNKFLLALSAFLLIFAVAPHGFAEEEGNDKAAIEALNSDVDEQMQKANEERRQSAEATYSKITKLVTDLPENEQQHFFMAYTNYNLIETVKVVQDDVGTAIDKCGENNPEMKEELKTRFKAWNTTISPLVKEAEGNFKNMLVAQDYASQGEIKDIFASIQDTREKTYNQIEKIPVTTPEACQYLLSKMDETQDSMTNILTSTLMTFPQVSDRLQQKSEQKKDEAKSENSSEKKERSKYE